MPKKPTVQEELAEARKQLAESRKELEERQAKLDQEQARANEEAKKAEALAYQQAEQARRLEELREAHESDASQAERQREELESARRRLEEVEQSLRQVQEERSTLEAKLEESAKTLQEKREALEVKEKAAADLQRRCDAQVAQLEASARDRAAAQYFLDIAVGECEFASPLSYSLTMQLRGRGERRSTDVSHTPSERPVFESAMFLLPTDADLAQDTLLVSAFVHVADPGGVPGPAGMVARLLGEGQVPLTDLKVLDGATTSRKVVHSVSFLRTATTGDAKQLTVGRATLTLQAKVLTPSEAAQGRPHQVPPLGLPTGFPSLDRGLWLARPFQHRLRALVHQAGSLPDVPPGGQATVRVAFRLIRADGQVLQETATADVPLAPHGGAAAPSGTEAAFGQELLLPLPASCRDLRAQLALELIVAPPRDGAGAGAAAAAAPCVTSASLLDLIWRPDALPPLAPLHLLAKPSAAASPLPSYARPRPTLMVSLLREPAAEALDSLGDSSSYGVEVRIHGVPPGRPLPDPIDGGIVAVCADDDWGAGAASGDTSALRIPVEQYFYDQRLDLAAFMDAHFRTAAARRVPKYFLTPALGRSRTPTWGQFVVRCLASTAALRSLTVLLFERGGARSDPDAPLGGSLLGFATVDAAALGGGGDGGSGRQPAEPLQRPFQADMRLLEAPGVGTCLEVDVRVWPRGGAGRAGGSPPAAASPTAGLPARPPTGSGGQPRLSSALQAAARHALGAAPAPSGSTSSRQPSPRHAAVAAVAAAGSVGAALQHEARELRLNHELSVQLAKEFNMRAAALKRAGEEIVELRRQVQLLRSENARLQGQLADEERLAEDVRQRPPPEGLESLSSAELAAKLQRALEKYREEKAKGAELSRRLDEALKEAARGRGLARSLEELERAHLEQNRELQWLQEENKKIDTYKQTTKAQEKVIAKLEKILENSLQEVQKAQRVQVDIERLKTENFRLRERCAHLAARRKYEPGGDAEMEELHKQVAAKGSEVVKLQGIVSELQQQQQQPPKVAAGGQQLGEGNPTAEELEREHQLKRAELEQRHQAAEQRLQMLQQQVTESSKRYGSEIATLRVEVAKRDARILELDYLLRDGGSPLERVPAAGDPARRVS